MYISPYLILRPPIFLCFVLNSVHFVLSYPKWMLSLLSTNQSQISEKLLFEFLLFFFKVFVLISFSRVICRNKSQLTASFVSLRCSRSNKYLNVDPSATPQSLLFFLNVYSKISLWKVQLKAIYWIIGKSRSWHFFSNWIMIYGVKSFLQID